MAFVLFRVFSLGIISCMIILFRSSMRNKQHADIAHDVVLGIQAFICREYSDFYWQGGCRKEHKKSAVSLRPYFTKYRICQMQISEISSDVIA